MTKTITENISTSIDNTIDTILAINYEYDIDEIFASINKLKDKEQDKLYEKLINDYLEKIKKNANITILKEIQTTKTGENFMDIYSPKYSTYHNTIEFFTDHTDRDFKDEIQYEAENIAWDLCYKSVNRNNRKLSLPISIEAIENYSIDSTIGIKNVKQIYKYIIVNLAIINRVLNDNKKSAK